MTKIPELPEVETVRRELADWLPSRTIIRARRADAPAGPKYRDLELADGQRILSVERRGKYLILPLDSGDSLVIHLGMSGVLRKTPSEKHLRVKLDLDGPVPDTLYFQDTRRFGRFLLAKHSDFSFIPTLHKMGPEPLSDAFTPAELHRRLNARSALKPLLLGQRAVAGLGNIYIDEALWRARLHPLTPGEKVSKQKANHLHKAIVTVLSNAIDSGGTTLNDYRNVGGETGDYQNALQAYGQTGQPCARCNGLIERIIVTQRSTHFCPSCQRMPTKKKRSPRQAG